MVKSKRIDEMKKIIIVSILLLSAISVSAQIKGLLLDSDRKPVSGAEIALSENPSVKTVSGVDGSFTIDAYPGEYLTVSHSNGLLWRFEIKAKEQVYILQKEAVIIQTGLTTRNIESNTAAISFITSDKIDDFNTERLYAPMYGTLSGLTVLQNLGWDWSSVPDLYIRGAGTLLSKTPLLVVDGFTRDISYLTSADIESISVLKDAAATALYGIQGANGVIVMTTKRGTYNSMKTEIDYSFGIDRPYDMPKYADALTYAKAVNEALYYDGLPQRYSQTELNAYASGKYPDLYPDVDWLDEGLRNLATNHHLGMSFSGGGKNLRYYTHIDYQNYMGLLAHAKDNAEYSTQLRKNHLSARVNLDVNISKTTEMKVGLYGLLYETQNPPGGEAAIFPLLYNTPANAFPIKTSNGYWGSSDYFQYNPIAKIADTGYANLNRRGLQADLRLNQDLSFILKGLQASVAVAWDNTAAYNEQQKKNYQYQVCVPGIANDGSIFTVSEDIFGENNTLAYSSSLNSQQMNSTFEAKIAYQRDFGKHWMDANVVYRQESLVPMGRNTIRKYQNVMFFGGYSYDSRFFLDVVANYYGSSVLLKGAKFDFYPAVSASWVMSNEDFIQANAIDFLKLRASWGRSGHTGFGYELDRYFYVSGNNYFYQSSNVSTPGMKESVLPLSELKSQLSESINLGLDLRLFKKFGLTADVFAEKRSRILLDTDSFYSGILGNTPPPDFSGEVGTYGTEISLSWENKSGDFSYSIGTDFSFVRSIVLENNEG